MGNFTDNKSVSDCSDLGGALSSSNLANSTASVQTAASATFPSLYTTPTSSVNAFMPGLESPSDDPRIIEASSVLDRNALNSFCREFLGYTNSTTTKFDHRTIVATHTTSAPAITERVTPVVDISEEITQLDASTRVDLVDKYSTPFAGNPKLGIRQNSNQSVPAPVQTFASDIISLACSDLIIHHTRGRNLSLLITTIRATSYASPVDMLSSNLCTSQDATVTIVGTTVSTTYPVITVNITGTVTLTSTMDLTETSTIVVTESTPG